MFCETGKIQYPTRVEAAKAAANLAKQDKRNKYSHYPCPICKMFHTKTVKKNRKMMPKKHDKYPIKVNWPPKEEGKKKKKRKR